MDNHASSDLPKRIDKTLDWLADSRDKWKEKCTDTKLKLKRQTLALKRTRDSRNEWKVHNDALKQELFQSKDEIKSLNRHIDCLMSQLEELEDEISSIKKRISLGSLFKISKTLLSYICCSANYETAAGCCDAISKYIICNEGSLQ